MFIQSRKLESKTCLSIILPIIIISSVFFLGGSIPKLYGVEESSTDSLVQEIIGEQGWGVVAVDSETNNVYVTNHRAGTISVLDGAFNSIQSTINIGGKPYGLGINTETKILYVAIEFEDRLAVVNGSSGEIITDIDLEKPYDIMVNSKTDKVYITSDDIHLLSVVDGKTNQIEKSFPVKNPCGVGVNEATNMIYVTSESENKVHVFDGASNEKVSEIEVGFSPRGVGVNPLTNTIYITNQASNSVSVINGTTNEVIDTIPVDDVPRRVVVMPATNTIYVANQFSNSLSVIDGTTNTVTDSIEVSKPFELTINPKEGKIYSSYFQNRALAIIDVSGTGHNFQVPMNIDECKENLQDDFIYVSSDKPHYDSGETISIWGCVSDISHSKGLNIQIIDPDGKIAKSFSMVPEIDGTFSSDFFIDERFGKDGEYSVIAEFGEYSSEKTFTVPEFEMMGFIVLASSISLMIFLFRGRNIILPKLNH